MLDCEIIVRLFKLHYYVHFQTNTLGIIPLITSVMEGASGGIGLKFNTDKTEFMYFNQRGEISTLNGRSLKFVDKFTYLGRSVSPTENDIKTLLTKAGTAINRLSVIGKSDLPDKIKLSFFSMRLSS